MKTRILLSMMLGALTLAPELIAGGNTTVVSCCNVVGNNINVTFAGGCTCVAGTGGRSRGDTAKWNLAGRTPTQLNTKIGGTVKVPNAGSWDLYQYGDIKIILATLYMKDTSKNPQVPGMDSIVKKAAQKQPWAKTMIWIGRALPAPKSTKPTDVIEFTEVQETYTDLDNLSGVMPIKYDPVNIQKVKFTIPASKNAPKQVATIDFNPIKKQK